MFAFPQYSQKLNDSRLVPDLKSIINIVVPLAYYPLAGTTIKMLYPAANIQPVSFATFILAATLAEKILANFETFRGIKGTSKNLYIALPSAIAGVSVCAFLGQPITAVAAGALLLIGEGFNQYFKRDAIA